MCHKNINWCFRCRPVQALYYSIIRRHNNYFKGRKNHYSMLDIENREELYNYLKNKFDEKNPSYNFDECLYNRLFEVDHIMPLGVKINGSIDIERCNKKNLEVILKFQNRTKGSRNFLIPLHLIPL